jgi:hypothetical protein
MGFFYVLLFENLTLSTKKPRFKRGFINFNFDMAENM